MYAVGPPLYPSLIGAPYPGRITSGVVNVLTIDVEDYFHVSAFEQHVRRADWDRFESRVERNTDRLLELLDEHGARATFFVLGWVAGRHPGLVRRIASAGHEIASHSYSHQLVYRLTPAEFREDLRRARDVIESVAGVRVRGFRAPSYSITKASLWALDVLVEEGYEYDASIFPIRHDRYGIPGAPRRPHVVRTQGGRLLEIPGSTSRVGFFTCPLGGGYFRLLPYPVTRRAVRNLNVVERQPAIFYLHPWEIDPGQPRLAASPVTRYRHYNHLHATEERLRRLLRDFDWDTIEACLLAPLGGSDGEESAGQTCVHVPRGSVR